MGGTPSQGTLSGLHDHHVQLCRFLTAQGCPAKEASGRGKPAHSPFPKHTVFTLEMRDIFPVHVKVLARPQVSSTAYPHRGPCGPAAPPHRCRSSLPSHQGGSAALPLQGRREGAGTKVAAGWACGPYSGSSGPWVQPLPHLPPSPPRPQYSRLIPSLDPSLESWLLSVHCWPHLPLSLPAFPLWKGGKTW